MNKHLSALRSEQPTVPASPPSSPLLRAPLGLRVVFTWMGTACFALMAAQGMHESAAAGVVPQWLSSCVNTLVLLAVGMPIWRHRNGLWNTVSGIKFGIAVFAVLAFATLLGTVVVQRAGAEVFYARYGVLAPWLAWLQFDELFVSWWFCLLLALFACGLGASIVRRGIPRGRDVGFLLTHGGIVLVLGGAALGWIWGSQGLIHLQVGEQADRYQSEREHALPFVLQLDDFQIERRESEYRLLLSKVSISPAASSEIASWDLSEQGSYRVAGNGVLHVLSMEQEGSALEPKEPSVQPGLWFRGPATVVGSNEAGVEDSVFSLRMRWEHVHGEQVISVSTNEPTVLLADSGLELRLQKRGDDIINFRSSLSLYDEGSLVLSSPVKVNQPLRYKGFTVYQAGYDPANPLYAGLMVVRDPGMPLVYLGLGAVLLGAIRFLLPGTIFRRSKSVIDGARGPRSI